MQTKNLKEILMRLRPSNFGLIKKIMVEPGGVELITESLIQSLEIWDEESEWVDTENIEFCVKDLGTLGFWQEISYVDFLNKARLRIAPKVTKHLTLINQYTKP